MLCGWVGKILDLDLTSGRTSVRETTDYVRDYLGGRALAARLAWELVPDSMDPYAPDNPIVIATGPLTGTLAPTSGRTVMASVSPKPYPMPWYTHSTLGGWFGSELKYAGFDALVVRGRADMPVRVEIADGSVRIVPAGDLWGRDARQVQLALRAGLGPAIQSLVIGPAGEHRVSYATVQHSDENAAGHSGLGAVWGAKRLKAISVRGTGAVAVAHGAALLREASQVGGDQISPPARFRLRPSPGDAPVDRPVCSQACRFTCLVNAYNHAPDGRRIPAVCVGKDWTTGMENTQYRGGGVEIPGGRNYDRAASASLHELCNSLGLDLYVRLSFQPWFARARELGIHAIRGLPIEPDTPDGFAAFLDQLATRQGLGALFADGLVRAVDGLAGELPEGLVRAAHALEFAFGFTSHREGRMLDEEPLPYWVMSAMMYASETRDPAIGSHASLLHLGEVMFHDRASALPQLRKLATEVWGDPDVVEPSYDRKARATIWAQDQHMLLDSLPLCDFAFPRLFANFQGWDDFASADTLAGDLGLAQRLFTAVTGESLGDDALARIAGRAFNLERCLLARAGRDRRLEEGLAPHFALPCHADGTAIDAAGFARLLDEYYAARGWDAERGWPLPATLAELGLSGLVSGAANGCH